MSATSALVPLAGVLTQPVMARALGATGRGEVTAAIAPAVLAGAVVTLGLPDALTYMTAKRPWLTRRAMAWASAISAVLGGVATLVVWALLPWLSDGNSNVSSLMLLSMLLAIPTFVTGVVRGAAMGHQLWGAVAAESAINTGTRLLVLVGLWIAGYLTPLVVVLVTFLGPLVAAAVYVPILRAQQYAGRAASEAVLRPLLSYGSKTWFGSVAGILGAMMGPILMTPLAGVRELGLYSVGTTVMDVPIIIALAISSALRGVNSRSNDPDQVVVTTRITSLLGLFGCSVLAVTASAWLPLLFGRDFTDAIVPAQILFGFAALYIPGTIAAAGLAAFGRPGLRSIGFALAVAIHLVGFLVLVPPFGILGACWAGATSGAVGSAFLVVAASRVLARPIRHFLIPRASDVTLLWRVWLLMTHQAGTFVCKARSTTHR